jgi:NAD dependent epimerase/dehydratase family enzyme
MKSVKVFFDKFNNTALKEISKRTIISEIIKREAKVVIPKKLEEQSFVFNCRTINEALKESI